MEKSSWKKNWAFSLTFLLLQAFFFNIKPLWKQKDIIWATFLFLIYLDFNTKP